MFNWLRVWKYILFGRKRNYKAVREAGRRMHKGVKNG